MGRQKRKNRPAAGQAAEETASGPRRGRLWWVPTAVLVLAAGLVVVFAVNVFLSGSRPAGGLANGGRSEKEMKAAGGDRTKPLIGKWLRPDGGYELHVESIGPDGKVTAKYLNPQPINIAEATAGERDGRLGLYVKFQDTGYPGSSYELAYDPERDVLVGSYYQAVQGETYEIEFTRVRQ